MRVRHQPGHAVKERQPRVVAVGAEKPRGDRDQPLRVEAGHIRLLRQRAAEGLLGDQDALGRDARDLGGHAEFVDEPQLLEQHVVAARHGGGRQQVALAAAEGEGRPDIAALAEEEELVDRLPGVDKRQRLHAAADAAQLHRVGLERVLHLRAETEILQTHQRQRGPEVPDGLAQGGPFAAGHLQQAYFVFLGEDESAVFICCDRALGCFFAQLIERPKSLPVTVQNSGPSFRAGEEGAFEEGFSSGEGVWGLHLSVTRPRSRRPRPNAKTIYTQGVHSGNRRRESNDPGLAEGQISRKPLA